MSSSFKHAILPLFNFFPNKPWFSCVCSISFLKTLKENEEEIALNGQFLLFLQCFLFFQRTFTFFKLYIVICKLFQFGKSLKFVVWERVKVKDNKQEGQDGPGSLTWIFERTIANFLLFLSEKNFKKNSLLTLFPNKPWFLRVCSTSLLKTLWEKEKLLVMSNFSFSHSVFYHYG